MEHKKQNYESYANRLIQMKAEDDRVRSILAESGELFNGYHIEMEAVHLNNARELKLIMNEIGYPTIQKVGEEANHAAWIIIQHAISDPNFMRYSLRLLEQAVNQQQANPIQLAYLSDRIAVYEGRAQLYGTSFDWDEKGMLSPINIEDYYKVNSRRIALGLNTLDERTNQLRKEAKNEGGGPPDDLEGYFRSKEEWREKVGWTLPCND